MVFPHLKRPGTQQIPILSKISPQNENPEIQNFKNKI